MTGRDADAFPGSRSPEPFGVPQRGGRGPGLGEVVVPGDLGGTQEVGRVKMQTLPERRQVSRHIRLSIL